MAAYEGPRLMLDPGLTALALRGLHEGSGHYPFLDQFRARGRSATRGVPAGCPRFSSASRSIVRCSAG